MSIKQKYAVILHSLVLVSLACSLPMLKSSQQLPDGLTENYTMPSDVVLNNPFSYSTAQQAVVQQYGSPTRFIILFGETARQETWFYDTAGYTVVFRDGEKVSEKAEAAEYREGMYATVHSPNLFYRGMTVDEIVLTTGKTKFMLTSLPDLDEMRLLDMEGLTVGLVDERISYVETIPALTETLLTPDDFLQLTSEEAANQGLHFYTSAVIVDGTTMVEDFGEIEIIFTEEELTFTYEGETILFNRVEPNRYYSDVDGGLV
ncbi:MAG TPA: hypothetical protein VJ965_04360, partial [Anaerolineales bacterium]|nr:hypothetical protein [Anaerolineales bacterium]